MKKIILHISLFIFCSFVMNGQVAVLSNNKFMSFSPTYSISYSIGELGEQRNKFFSDFNKILASKGYQVKAKFRPRHSFGYNTKIGAKFNKHIFLALNLGYNRRGHVESFEYYKNDTLTMDYELQFKMDYLSLGAQLILFHPKNFHAYFGFSNNFNVRNQAYAYSKNFQTNTEEHDYMFFNEYYEEKRMIFLYSYDFGVGYIYQRFGLDLNFSYTGNAFLLPKKEIKFFTGSVGLTYYLTKKKSESILKGENI